MHAIIAKPTALSAAGGALLRAVRRMAQPSAPGLLSAPFTADQASLYAERMTRRMMAKARRTAYGRAQPRAYEQWPVLERRQWLLAPRDHALPLQRRAGLAEQALLARLLAPFGADPDDAYELALPAQLNETTMLRLHGEIMRAAPSLLRTTALDAARLLAALHHTGCRLHVPALLLAGDGVTPALHRALERELHASVLHVLRQEEGGWLLHASQPGRYYAHPAYSRMELHKPDADGLLQSACTGFWQQGRALVRFDGGERFFPPGDEAACKAAMLGQAPFGGLAAREHEFVLTRAGQKLYAPAAALHALDELYMAQLHQHDFETAELRFLPAPAFGGAALASLRGTMRRVLPGFHVTLTPATTLHARPDGSVPRLLRPFQSPL